MDFQGLEIFRVDLHYPEMHRCMDGLVIPIPLQPIAALPVDTDSRCKAITKLGL